MKKIIIPSICFAVLSTPAFEKVVDAAINETPSGVHNIETTMKYVNVHTGSSLNVRKSDSTTSSIVTKLEHGTPVTVFSEKNGWAKVKAIGKTGYVSTKYLSLGNNSVSEKEEHVRKYVDVQKGSNLNLRISPSTNAEVISKLPSGKEVIVSSDTNGWAKVKVDGKVGYVSSSYIKAKKQSSSPNPTKVQSEHKYVNVSTGSNLNMRSQATTSASILTKLSSGTEVSVLSDSNGWSKVKVNGKEGFVSSQFLSSTKATSTKEEKKENVVKTKISYVDVSTGSNLNLRSKATTSSSILMKLSSGTEVSVISDSNGWSKVKVDGKEGFVSSQFLTSGKATSSEEEKKEDVVKTTKRYVEVSPGSSLNMRSNPKTSASVIVKLSKGTEVVVYSESNGWAKVKAYGKDGYVSSQFLASRKKSSTEDKKPDTKTTTRFVEVAPGSKLNMRKSATTSSAIVTTLAAGTEVKVFSESGGWAKVEANGKKGYTSVKYLSLSKPQSNTEIEQSEPKEEEMTVSKVVDVKPGSHLNMRNKPTITASVVVKLANGVVVDVLSESNGWSKINVYGHNGYVSSEFLSVKSNSNSNEKTDQSDEKTEPIVDESTPISDSQDDQISLKYVNVNSGSSLNMRSGDSTTASIVSKLSRGTVVKVLSESNGWAKVSANGKIGYVSSEFLIASAVGSSNASEVTKNLIYENYEITLEEMLNKQMEVNPQTDRVYDTYLREDALILDNPVDPTSGVVQGSTWNLRGSAGTENRVIGKVKKGERLKILSQVKGKDGYVWYKVKTTNTWVNAGQEDVVYYLNPSNFIDSPVDSLQFLKLSKATDMNEAEVNGRILSGKGILAGKAASFIQAGKNLGINEIYLISHALLETGNGTSELAQGVVVNGKTVYNMYGIGAYDGSALSSGSQYAYKQGWFTPEDAIIGGAKFISQGYINAGQDTLYKMRWNPGSIVLNGAASHQYASDIGWATKQVNQIYNLYSLLDSYKITLEIPKYK